MTKPRAMQDNLKEYLDENRTAKEFYSFDLDAGWNELAPKVLEGKKKPLNRTYLSIAASISLLVLALGYWVTSSNNEVNPIAEEEHYYEHMIQLKVDQVKGQVNDPTLLADLDALDQVFSELKKDLNDDVDNQEVVIAMMENYQLKLKILERILEEIEENETTDETIRL